MRLLLRLLGQLALHLAVWVVLVTVIFLAPFERMAVANMYTRPLRYGLMRTWSDLLESIGWVLRGETIPTFNRGTPLVETLSRIAPPSLTMLVVSLAVALVVGVGVGLLLRLAPRRLQALWNGTLFGGTVLPESLIAGFLFMGLVVMITRWGIKPVPALWISDITWKHYVLPVIALAVFPIAYIGRVVATVLDELAPMEFMQAARAKGLSEAQLLFGHAFRHVAHRVVTVLPNLIPWQISALMAVEWVFLIPGLGRHAGWMLFLRGVDPFLLTGILTIFMLFLILVQAGTTILAAWLDPRGEHHA
ncbi:MAG: ABC transporter permease subunit [Bacillota bacterium]